MRAVLCYGDSNTYGAIPGEPGARYGVDGRWPGILQGLLGPDWQVVEEGLPGRTTISDDPVEGPHLNGRRYLRPCLESHRPIEIVVIMLGTNDLKTRFQKTATEIALGMAALVQDIREDAFRSNTEPPAILLVAPPPILNDLQGWDCVFEDGYEKSQKLADEYLNIAEAQSVGFLNAGDHASCSVKDGFHIDSIGAVGIGQAIAEMINEQWA